MFDPDWNAQLHGSLLQTHPKLWSQGQRYRLDNGINWRNVNCFVWDRQNKWTACLINTDVNARYSWRKMMKNALFVGCISCLWWCDHADPQRHHHLGCRRGENRDSKSLILGVDHRTDWLRVDSWGCLVLSTEWFVHHQNQKMILLPAKIRSFIDAGGHGNTAGREQGMMQP